MDLATVGGAESGGGVKDIYTSEYICLNCFDLYAQFF
jgi:hypothetical protein